MLLAGYSPAGLDRVARRRRLDPVGLPVEMLAPGRPSATWRPATARPSAEFVVRANMLVGPTSARTARRTTARSTVAADVDATRRAGAHEIVLGLFGDHCLNEALEHYACVAEAAELVPLA